MQRVYRLSFASAQRASSTTGALHLDNMPVSVLTLAAMASVMDVAWAESIADALAPYLEGGGEWTSLLNILT